MSGSRPRPRDAWIAGGADESDVEWSMMTGREVERGEKATRSRRCSAVSALSSSSSQEVEKQNYHSTLLLYYWDEIIISGMKMVEWYFSGWK